jgi:hypothetical protein
MDTAKTHTLWTRSLIWEIAGAMAAQLILPRLLSRAARIAETRDFPDCHEH